MTEAMTASDLKAHIAKGLASEICGTDPIVNGEEWSVDETEADGEEITLGLESEDGKSYGARLRAVEVWGN